MFISPRMCTAFFACAERPSDRGEMPRPDVHLQRGDAVSNRRPESCRPGDFVNPDVGQDVSARLRGEPMATPATALIGTPAS